MLNKSEVMRIHVRKGKFPVKVASLNNVLLVKKNVCIFIPVIPELDGKILVSAHVAALHR